MSPIACLSLLLAVNVVTARAAQLEAQTLAPTATASVTVPTDPAAKKQLVQQITNYMALPVPQVRVHPAAADFPGVAPAGSPHLTRVVTFSGAKPRWQITGLYANAGEIVTVTPQTALPAGATVEIRIGCHTDRLFNDKITAWKRFPSISRAFTLAAEPMQVASAFGGPIFAAVKAAKANAAANVDFAKADLTGFFKPMGYPCPDSLCGGLKSLSAFNYAAWRKEQSTKN